ncbi:hypothetical protein, partial [Endozoicomonas sp. ALB060]|uniref:hypothetical protein n=1 Tax=Endozoicomonas sp. ALB060 TaxID=3403072 RepID=UPI003BB75B1C
VGLPHVRVGHRQALNIAKPQLRDRLGFLLCPIKLQKNWSLNDTCPGCITDGSARLPHVT